MNLIALINYTFLPGLLLFFLTKKKNNLHFIDNVILLVPFSIGTALFSTWVLTVLKKLDNIGLLFLTEIIFILIVYLIISVFSKNKLTYLYKRETFNLKNSFLEDFKKYKIWYFLTFFFVVIFLYQSFRFSYLYAAIHYDPLYQIILLSKKILSNGGIDLPFEIFWDPEVSIFAHNTDHFVSYAIFYHPFKYIGHIYFSIFNNLDLNEFARIQNFIISTLIIISFSRLVLIISDLKRYYIFILMLLSCSSFILFSHVLQAEIYLLYFSLLFVLCKEFSKKENSPIFLSFCGLFLSFALLSRPLAYSLLAYVIIDFLLDKKNRKQNLQVLLLLFPFFIFYFVTKIYFETTSFLIFEKYHFLKAAKIFLNFIIQLPFFNTNAYDANSWGYLINIFFLIGLVVPIKILFKSLKFSIKGFLKYPNKAIDNFYYLHKVNFHLIIIFYSISLFFIIIAFTKYGHTMMHLFSNYMVIIVPNVLIIASIGINNFINLLNNKNHIFKFKVIFLILFFSSFQLSIFTPKNIWLWAREPSIDSFFKFHSFKETLKIVNPKWQEMVAFVDTKLDLKKNEKILSIPPYPSSYFENVIFFDDKNFNKIKHLNKRQDVFKKLEDEQIAYVILMNDKFHLWYMVERTMFYVNEGNGFKGHKIFYDELFNKKKSDYVKEIFNNDNFMIYQINFN